MDTPTVERVKAKFAAMPSEKLGDKIVRTVIGAVICAFGWLAKSQWPNLPDLVAYGTAVFGGVVIAGEVISYPFKLFVAMLRDVLDAVRGKNSP